MTKVVLKTPVSHDGKTYSEIEINEPTVGAIEAMDDARTAGKGDIASLIAMLAHDTGMPIEAIRKVRKGDFERISEAFAPFGEPTGAAG